VSFPAAQKPKPQAGDQIHGRLERMAALGSGNAGRDGGAQSLQQLARSVEVAWRRRLCGCCLSFAQHGSTRVRAISH
jgi:hypothetical protein